MNVYQDVLQFWRIGHPDKVREDPGIPEASTQELNLKLIEEELTELKHGVETADVVEIADALADLIYVTAGMAATHGIPLDLVWGAVQRSNMAKFPNGVVTRREDGKVMKPEGWKPPDIKKILDAYTRGKKMDYGDKIVECFKYCCDNNEEGDGASPDEVTAEMAERGWLSSMDTVIDIADTMKTLRGQGRL